MTIILILSVPLTLFLGLQINYLRQPPTDWGKHRFPIFYLEEPFLFANHREEQFLVLNNSDYQQLQLLGDFTHKNDDFREPLTKYNNYIFYFKKEHYFREIPEYINFIEIMDVSDYANPQLIGELQLPIGYDISHFEIYVHEFVAIDNGLYLFLQDEDNHSFLVINCTNMQQPELVDAYQFPGEAGQDFSKLFKFFIKGKTVFIPTLNATSSVGLTIYNFTALNNLTKIGEWFGNTYLSSFDSVFASQDYLYFKKWNSGVEVFNIQNLTHPTRSGFVVVPGYDLFCHKNYVFGVYFYTFSIYDCSNTSNTEPIFSYAYPYDTYIKYHYVTENLITDNYFYFPFDIHKWKNETLHIWDWSNPNNITIKTKLGLPTVPPLNEPIHWTYKKIVAPIIVGDVLVTTLGILLLRRIKAKKK